MRYMHAGCQATNQPHRVPTIRTQAAELFRSAGAKGHGSTSYAALGECMLEMGRFKEAAHAFQVCRCAVQDACAMLLHGWMQSTQGVPIVHVLHAHVYAML
jgi:hypothetical protein